MADKARKLTDQELNKLEREIYELYATASNEISAKWRKYMASHKKTIDKAQKELEAAKKLGDRDAIAVAQENYERTVKNVTLNDIRYKTMLNETTAKLANVNQLALDYVNGDMPKIYTINYNAFADQKLDGYTFTLVNERAVAALALSNEIRLPKKKVNIPKDEAWNAKNINSQLMQGILQGESIPKIAKRLQNVTNMNRNSAIRNARTMTTGAENQGRQDSFKKASSDGVLMKRRWVATHDERVRAWHSDLDGVEVDVDEPFQNDFGDIMYPGDPTAAAANVYNCRCSIRAVVKGFAWNKKEDEKVIDVDERINISSDVISDIVGDNSGVADQIYEYAGRMSSEDVAKFNEIFNRAEFVESYNGSHYVPETNRIELDKTTMRGETMFHESTHWFDYNQDYTITDDWGRFKRVYDDDGNLINKEWVPDIVTIKEHAGFSQYIAHEWDKYEIGASTTAMADDRVNVVKKLGISDTYGNNRKPEDVKHDLDAINKYLESKGISKTDPDFVHLSDFISAMTYDASLGSLTTGGHDYDYWVSGNEYVVTEITAGYNVLKCIGRTDLIEIEKELAPKLMVMIEEEWKKIW